MNRAATMDTSRALKLVPLPELSTYSDLTNFRDWKHAILFHLSYHNLDCFLRENENENKRRVGVKEEDDDGAAAAAAAPVISDDDRRRRLLAYSIIWSSVKKIIPFVERRLDKKLRDDGELDPKTLWQLILEYHKTRFPSQDM